MVEKYIPGKWYLRTKPSPSSINKVTVGKKYLALPSTKNDYLKYINDFGKVDGCWCYYDRWEEVKSADNYEIY